MTANKDFQAEITSSARFHQARTALEAGREAVLLDFSMLDVEPSPTTISLQCSLNDTRKLVHTCLAALASLGDQPATVLLKVLRGSPHERPIADARIP